jgi:hypothetical protein
VFLLIGQFRAEHKIEELNRIIERQQAPIVSRRRWASTGNQT